MFYPQIQATADGGGIITAMAFASGGVISGPVTYDSVNDAYVVETRTARLQRCEKGIDQHLAGLRQNPLPDIREIAQGTHE